MESSQIPRVIYLNKLSTENTSLYIYKGEVTGEVRNHIGATDDCILSFCPNTEAMSYFTKMRFPFDSTDTEYSDHDLLSNSERLSISDSEFSSGLPSISGLDEDEEWESNVFGSSQSKPKTFQSSESSGEQESSQPKGGNSAWSPNNDFQESSQNSKQSAPKRKYPQEHEGSKAKERKIPRKDAPPTSSQSSKHENQRQNPGQPPGKSTNPGSSTKEQKRPWSSNKEQKRPWSSTKEQKSPWSSTKEQNRPWSSTKEQKSPWSSTKEQKRPWSSTKEQKSPWSSTKEQKRPWSSTKEQNRPWSSTKEQNRPWSSTKEQKRPSPTKTGYHNPEEDESYHPQSKTGQPSKRVQPKRQAKTKQGWRFQDQNDKETQRQSSSTNKTKGTKASQGRQNAKGAQKKNNSSDTTKGTKASPGRPNDKGTQKKSNSSDKTKGTEASQGRTNGEHMENPSKGRYVPTGPLSNSRRWLQDGSHHYKSVIDNLPWKVKTTRQNMALNSYYKALNIAETSEDKASASKNMGLASWKMASVLAEQGAEEKKVNFYYKEGMKSLYAANKFGKDMSSDWRDKLAVLSSRCWDEIQQRYVDLDLQKRSDTLRPFVPYLVSNLHKAEAYLSEVDMCFKAAINAIQKKDFKLSLSLLRDCYFPINEAKKYGSDFLYVTSEVKVYEKDTFLHMCISESMQALKLGDELYVKLLEDEERLNMELVYEIMDLYKQSILLTRDQDLELEAMGHSRIGRMYHGVLKNKYRAKQNFRYALDLAQAMEPRNFYMEEWYKTAANILSQYQQEIDNDEETKRRRARDAILLELKQEVKQLRESFDRLSKWDFLQFVYKTFPPKKKSHTLGEITTACPEGKTLKKLFQKAVVHYHPDKADEETHGKQWKVFTEEITKYLTRHYETFKGF